MFIVANTANGNAFIDTSRIISVVDVSHGVCLISVDGAENIPALESAVEFMKKWQKHLAEQQ